MSVGRHGQRGHRQYLTSKGGSGMTTSSFNPIIRREEIIGWNPFAARPKPEPGVAIVLVRKDPPWLVLLPDDPLARSLMVWSQYRWACWIDTREHTVTLQCRLPSIEPGLAYQGRDYHTLVVRELVAI